VLPTLAVILWAYGMYALFAYFRQRRGGHLRARNRWGKLSWFTLTAMVGAGVALFSWCCLSPDKNDHRLKLAGFLGTVYAEGWPDRVDQVNFPPVKGQGSVTGEQPVYALLHPETPVSQLEPEKKLPKPRPGRTVKKAVAPSAQDKAAKATAPASKKDKTAAKNRTNKKKRTTAARGRQANAG
jgi:hypothetical protein